MANLRDGFPKAVGNSVTNTSELEIPEREAANPRGDPSYIRSSDRARVRNFLNAIIRRPTFDLGISTPSNADIIDPNYVAEEPCFRPLLLATVLLRMIHNADWGFLLPMIPGDRALMSRRLPTSDSARVDILTNHTFDGRVVGVTYPITPPLPFPGGKEIGGYELPPRTPRRIRRSGWSTSRTPFLPRRYRIPAPKADSARGSAIGAFLGMLHAT